MNCVPVGRQINGRLQSSKRPHLNGQLLFNTSGKAINLKSKVFLTSGPRTIGYSSAKNKNKKIMYALLHI